MVFIPGLGGSSFPGGLAGIPGADGAAGPAGAAGTDAPLGGAGYSYFFDDFITATPNLTGWAVTNSSGAYAKVGTGVDSASQALGVGSMSTSTSATGTYCINLDTGSDSIIGGYATFEQEWRVYLSNLSDGSNRYLVRIGFSDASSPGNSVVDGVYFEYVESTSANWRCCTSSNSSRTETNSGIAVAAGSFIKLKIVFSPTDAKFYINGNLVVTTTTNLPTGAGRWFGITCGIQKTIGLSARLLNVDYFKFTADWTTDR